eukprot:TRINITY_DN11958_c0_g1_i1.p1 TRINITY_DN11958_c0_g1~~TRINITY_DN11958_c0_g1_i1.p1  ORF type:complete len:181 (-),score=35.19 TRINITY_DN11958_c0_g1_i1:29-571(-)
MERYGCLESKCSMERGTARSSQDLSKLGVSEVMEVADELQRLVLELDNWKDKSACAEVLQRLSGSAATGRVAATAASAATPRAPPPPCNTELDPVDVEGYDIEIDPEYLAWPSTAMSGRSARRRPNRASTTSSSTTAAMPAPFAAGTRALQSARSWFAPTADPPAAAVPLRHKVTYVAVD